MEDINLHNYEAFLLDYSEGTLSPEATAALEAFLAQHPELELSLDELALPALVEENFSIDFKSTLKKNESDLPDELMLRYLEGLLSPEEQAAFEQKLQNDAELANDLVLYRKTILHPEAVDFEKSILLKSEDDLILNNSIIAYVEGQLPASEKAVFEKELKSNAALKAELALVLKTKASADLSIIYPDKAELKKEGRVIALFSVRTAAAILLLVGLIVVFNQFNAEPVTIKEVAVKNNENKTGNTVTPSQTMATQTPIETEIQATKNPATNILENAVTKNNTSIQPTKTVTAPAIQPISAPTIAQHNNPRSPASNEKQEIQKPEASKTELAAAEPDTSALIDEATVAQQLVLATVEDTGEDLENGRNSKKGFWDKAVQMAKRVNKLGVKSVDGVEKPNKTYALSFNSFSVEKK